MDEHEYWLALEYRLCDEFKGLPQRRMHSWWCDGLTPSEFVLDGPEPKVNGHAWICDGPRQDSWRFTLFLDRTYPAREAIHWPSLLPPPEVTRWIAIDEGRKLIQIEPSASVPDLEP